MNAAFWEYDFPLCGVLCFIRTVWVTSVSRYFLPVCLEEMEGLWFNGKETKLTLVVTHIRLSSNRLPDSFVYPQPPPKNLVVNSPDSYYYFTTNGVRSLQNLA